MGQTLLSKSFNCDDRKIILDVKSFADGIYIIQVLKNNEWSKTQKLIISR